MKRIPFVVQKENFEKEFYIENGRLPTSSEVAKRFGLQMAQPKTMLLALEACNGTAKRAIAIDEESGRDAIVEDAARQAEEIAGLLNGG